MEDDDAKSASDKSDSEGEAQKVEKKPEKKAAEKKNKNKKDNKKGKKGKQDDDDDLDALLESLDKPTGKEGKGGKKGKKEDTPQTEESVPEVVKEEKKEEIVEEKPVTEQTEAVTVEGGDADGKKKKKKKKKKGGEKEEEGDGEGETEKTEENEKAEGEGEEDGEGEEGGKKKKKKDKKKKEEKPKKNKQAEMIKELLRARQEAEEAELKKRQEEEERLERLEKQREEEERIAQEKKEAEKQRKKERDDQLKKEGKYLTPQQRAKQQQAQARLAALGIDVDKIKQEAQKPGQNKVFVYDDRKKKKQKQAETTTVAATTPEVIATTSAPVKEVTPPVVPVEEVKEQTPEEEDAIDDWELADESEIKTPAPAISVLSTDGNKEQPKTVEKSVSKEEEASQDESSDEDSDDSDEESSEEESSEDEEEVTKGKETKEEKMEKVRQRLKKRGEMYESKRSTDHLRAPVICVLGHVDTGKTKMLDTIRRTNVQDGEAGGITQQIGATQVPADAIKERCKNVRDFHGDKMKIPGFLVIDTPGHESFANLRNRGSSLCDFAILVVDIMHGLEPQTIESLKLLLKRKTPFVIALNKIDRLYMYESNPRKDVYAHLKSQPQNTQLEFKDRYDKIVTEFAEQGLNVMLSNQNKNLDEYISIVPTSAYCGDGVGNLMAYIAQTTQDRYAQKLAFSEELECTVMEVKAIAGLGTTIDVILVNGTLRVGDIIVLTGSDGAIMTQVRELLMPQPLKELRVKNEYGHFKEIKGAQGVKLLAKNLEKCLAGLPMFVAHREDEVDLLKADCEAALDKALTSIKKKSEGVYVQASTLGSLEALLEFLKTQKIPYSNVSIGPVHKKDVQKAAVMLEHKKEYACVLAFDVKVEKDAQQFADHEGVKIFQADIIYHLEDNFLKYREELRLKARKEHEHLAIFPVRLRVLPQHVFNARNPIVCGVVIEAGQLKKGTPICVPSKDCIWLGNVSSIERNHEEVNLAKAGDEVCIKIENTTGEAPKLYGRHFTHEDSLVSRINRESIDACKTYFRDDLSKEDWQLIVALKKQLDIM